uniref:EGF-like domain protein n=1 Tax=Anisakis simplex TaxID=6269 RepID=A0A0M3JEE7_ANISI
LNGGRCIDEVNNYKCHCPEGFSGTLCQDRMNACLTKPCQNGGRCIDLQGGGYLCKCPHHYRGKNCDIEIDECEPNPCRNGGTCINIFGGYHCECPSCLYGQHCELVEPRCTAAAVPIGPEMRKNDTARLPTKHSTETDYQVRCLLIEEWT